MTPAERFVFEARSMIGARWQNGGRQPWAVDCGGLVLLSARAAGIDARDIGPYGRDHWNIGISNLIASYCGDPVIDWMPGDIAVMQFSDRREPSHCAIIGDYPSGGLSLIHSRRKEGVTEHRLTDEWAEKITEVYRPWQTL